MRTYTFLRMLCACAAFLGCSKSDNGLGSQEDFDMGVEADYTVLLEKNGPLEAQLLEADLGKMVLSTTQSSVGTVAAPELVAFGESAMGVYHSLPDCKGQVSRYDFIADTRIKKVVFEDLLSCDYSVIALTFVENLFFIGYVLSPEGKDPRYFIRTLDLGSTTGGPADVELDQKPVRLVYANDRLFILTLDEEVTGENAIKVLDLNSNTLIYADFIGYDARTIFADPENHIVISYDELHTLMDSKSLTMQFTPYGSDTKPNFSQSTSLYYDTSDRLYYDMAAGNHSSYPTIPAVYDFPSKTVYVYAFENFLTETERSFEFEIAKTTSVGYDEANNLILIGYAKSGTGHRGGLMRIKPVPDPEFVDNLDLDGVPVDIIIR